MPEYIRHDEGTFSSLTKQQKEAVGLLSIGTFLEYFDLMLYVHMAVLLNELFFPKADPHTATIYSALAFCSTYVLRPFGALIFGWIGDHMGRKTTVIITTFMMSISCIIMANLPTYAQIGITATYIISICRIIQGISSMGEIIGAEIYLTEITKPPVRYPIVAIISFISSLGGSFALAIAAFVTSFGLSWRIAFWIGAGVAIIGTIARTTLRETKDFAAAKKTLESMLEECNQNPSTLQHSMLHEKINISKAFALFCVSCAWPVCFYFIYIYCGNILKTSFNYTAEQVINHNLIISIGTLLGSFTWSFLSYYIYPLKIAKAKLIVFSVSILLFPYLLTNIHNSVYLLLIQLFLAFFAVSELPTNPILFKHFPIFKRFTYASFMYAISRTIMYIITSFGIVYLVEYFNYWGVLIIIIPVLILYTFGLYHFEKLEKEVGNYPKTIMNMG
ncbi:MFS transporter [Rickettsia rhipicephali]|uniref:MFS transporter n=1 Tax=Rickettsia rhipicephali TaxID=33992 RepID=UPI00070A5964|nr:MFS transporter [Rickettsia rhipicephali]ALN41267.1 MFS transporter [Rickettsia rhipicephali]